MSPTSQLLIRPIRREDRNALAEAFERLSDESRYRRFLTPKPRLSARELDALTDVDHLTHEAVVAVDPRGHLVGVARYAPWPNRVATAELAITVADEWQGKGLGIQLAARAVVAARDNGIAVLTGSTLWENEPARRILSRLGFRAIGAGDGVVDYRLDLGPVAAAA
jgi:RimJ/RimL family protein N-acetyltransferase